MTDFLETTLLASEAVIAVQKGGVLTVEQAGDLLGIAMQCCAATRRIAVTFHRSQENLRKQLDAAQVKTVDGDYAGLERDPGVVGNQPGQDNEYHVRDGQNRFASMTDEVIAKNVAYARDMARTKPAGYDEPGFQPERSEP